jgi:dUTPase
MEVKIINNSQNPLPESERGAGGFGHTGTN